MTRRLFLVVALLAPLGCGDKAPTPAADPNGPRPIPGGAKPAGNKTEWDDPKAKTKPGK